MYGTDELRSRLLTWIGGGKGAFGSFDEAALAVFAHQYAANEAYGRYCRALGKKPDQVTGWREIPALPTDAFKFPDWPVRAFPGERVIRTFLTSGTTREVRGRHDFEDLSLYETAVREGWKALGLPEISNPWFLSQSPADAPHSSLVHMFATLAPGARRWLIDGGGRMDGEALRSGVETGSGPVALFSTALALLAWTGREAPLRLPEGSWVFETGGYKGLGNAVDPAVFRERVADHFGIPAHRILNEYSMTELSSQFYRWPDEAAHRGPFWTRVRVIDPETGRPAGEGQPGYLEIIDLANLGSVMAIRTQDLAIARGERSFTLLGRDPGALPRGCSRGAEDLLQRS